MHRGDAKVETIETNGTHTIDLADVRQRNRAGGGGGIAGPLYFVGGKPQPRPGGGMAGG